MKKKLKEATVFKDRVNNVDAFFAKRTIGIDPKYGGRQEQHGSVNAEVDALLTGEKWTTIRGYQQLLDKIDAGKVVMFQKFDDDFYNFGDKLNKTMKPGEKLWVSLGGYGGEDIDWEKTLGSNGSSEPSDDELDRSRKSYYNWMCIPYDAIRSVGKPDTWKKVHASWGQWLNKTPIETKKEYLDDAWLGDLGYSKEK